MSRDDSGVLWLRHAGEGWQRLERIRLARATPEWLAAYREENRIPWSAALIVLPLGLRPSVEAPESFDGESCEE